MKLRNGSFHSCAHIAKALLLLLWGFSISGTDCKSADVRDRSLYVANADGNTQFLTDSQSLLKKSRNKNAHDNISELSKSFHGVFGDTYGKWAVSVHIALVDEFLNEPLETFAYYLAEDKGLGQKSGGSDNPSGLALVLQPAEGKSSMAIAGGLLSEGSLASEPFFQQSARWISAEQLAMKYLRENDIVAAVRVLFDGLTFVLSGANSVQAISTDMHAEIKQPSLQWKSPFQKGDIYASSCGDDKVCLQLFLDDARQFSTAFEHYYHEAMAYPALMVLGSALKRRVLILGGGDGGVARDALKFPTVEKVINIDIDQAVTEHTKKYFPEISQGLSDSRCQMLHEDAFAWVDKEVDAGGKFDLVIIDFTDNPLEGKFTDEFYKNLRSLLTDDGIIVQNLGAIGSGFKQVSASWGPHVRTMGSVFPLSLVTPDQKSPYLLALSSVKPDLKPLEAPDWNYWESLKIKTRFYGGKSQHEALFLGLAAEARAIFGLPTTAVPRPLKPSPIKLLVDVPAGRARKSGTPGKIHGFEQSSDSDSMQILAEYSPAGNAINVSHAVVTGDNSAERRLYINAEPEISLHTDYHEEAMVLPALSILGDRAKRVLVLGGGVGSLARLILQWPSLAELVLVEADKAVVEVAKKYYPERSKAFEDPRTKLVIDSAFDWIVRTDIGKFDLVLFAIKDQIWVEASSVTRVPKTSRFYMQLRSLVAPGGLFVQEAGSRAMLKSASHLLSLHKKHFAKTWPMAFGTLSDGVFNVERKVDSTRYLPPNILLLSSVNQDLDPCQIDWKPWQAFEMHATEMDAPELMFYGPTMHCSLFTVPAELEALFGTKSPETLSTFGQLTNAEASDYPIQDAESEAFGCAPSQLDNRTGIDAMLRKMADVAGWTVLSGVDYQFEPHGITALLLGSGAHDTIHTWPEIGYAVIDMVSVKGITAKIRESIQVVIKEYLQCSRVDVGFRMRGKGFPLSQNGPEQTHQKWIKTEL
eukprot:TRINITY_DN15744_c1_g2_i1.p1 TRINITY_DN15744_c1_g2~~TRINITY_DN15744_c1_g2_i1.p1  ORF type:complete len:981 (-),score=165.09 TRINITY_DN15744_c1_g2_i1:283-3225(-)